MKNIIILVLVIGGGLFGWHKFVHGYWAGMVAKDFVEELRLGMDNGHLSKAISSWHPPLPEEQLTLPPDGISPDFTVRMDSEPTVIAGKTTISYVVTFGKSPMATSTRNIRYEYRLTLVNDGSLFLPKWGVTQFHPSDRRARRTAA